MYLSNFSSKDKSWDIHRRESDQIAELYELGGYERYVERLNLCSNFLTFTCSLDELGGKILKLKDAHFCRLRHCAVCAWRKALAWRARFYKALPNILRDYSGHSFIFLTLTVKNCSLEELRATVQAMNKSWTRLSQRKGFPGVGWIKSLEVTRAADESAHPHFHVLLMVKPSYFGHGYWSQAKWTDTWQSAARLDYKPIVNIKAIRPKTSSRSIMKPDYDWVQAGIKSALLETFKYTIKPSDIINAMYKSPEEREKNSQWLIELTKQLHATRSIAIGGVFKSYLKEDEPEDLINVDPEVEEDIEDDGGFLTFTWIRSSQRYKLYEP